MIGRILIFLLLNFFALGIGSIFTGSGVSSEWYESLNKAPWTPPGWVFGAAWSFLMICFAFYLAALWPKVENRKLLLGTFIVQWILNVSWNPVFFYFQLAAPGLLIITLLTLVVSFFLINYQRRLGWKSVLILPYFIWLLIATSLNAYILLYN